MQDHYEQIESLLRQSHDMPDSSARTALIKECVHIADLTQDQICQFHVRAIFIHCAFESGAADEMLVALGWCIGVYDKDPELFDTVFEEPNLIIGIMSRAFGYLTDFPSISRERIESMLDDYERRHREAGLGLRSIYLERTRCGFWMGDREIAKENFQKFQSSPRKDGWDSESERIFKTDFYVHMGDDAAAVAEAAPVIQSDAPANDVTHWVMCFVLESLVRLNRLEDAQSCHQRSYRLCRDNPKYLGLVSMHANYLTAIGNHAKAIAMIEEHAPWLLETRSIEKKMAFYVVGWKLCRDLADAGTSSVCLRLPDSVGPDCDNDRYPCRDLADWFQREAEQIAALFDKRNGNDAISQSVQKMLDVYPGNAPS